MVLYPPPNKHFVPPNPLHSYPLSPQYWQDGEGHSFTLLSALLYLPIIMYIVKKEWDHLWLSSSFCFSRQFDGKRSTWIIVDCLCNDQSNWFQGNLGEVWFVWLRFFDLHNILVLKLSSLCHVNGVLRNWIVMVNFGCNLTVKLLSK